MAEPAIVHEVDRALNEALTRRGRVNILIAGKTGVGKSTLINAVFQGQLATTGQGRPVTKDTREITKEGIPVSIFDTRGLEMQAFAETLQPLEALLRERQHSPSAQEHMHVAWVCLAEDTRRIEDGERHLVDMLAKHVPVIAIITKARADQGFRRIVQAELPAVKNVMRVRALSEELDDGHSLPPMGLLELIDVTMQLVPEAHRNALTAAQKVDINLKRDRAHQAVAAAAAAAAAAGATPIPFADAVVLVPIQIGMLAQITAVFGFPLSTGFLTTLIGSVITGTAATLTGRALVGALLKMVPGAGTAAGMTVSAITASALTTAFGEAYIAALTILYERNKGEPPSDEEIIKAFREQLGKR
ncbi:MAG: Flp pilus assembly complex ATPase component TadA [Chloroflexaceae bacterium]|nr:Flp pilus assembly complex ATPase component TadA [Chloroflexaceae bacterium]